VFEQVLECRRDARVRTAPLQQLSDLFFTPGLEHVNLIEQRAAVARAPQKRPEHAVDREHPQRARAVGAGVGKYLVEGGQAADHGLEQGVRVVEQDQRRWLS
jgi:hypothetical protein